MSGHAGAAVTPEDARRRLAAKRNNENVRLFATLMNNLSVGSIVAGVLSPVMAGRTASWVTDLELVFTAFALHIAGQVALRLFLKSED